MLRGTAWSLVLALACVAAVGPALAERVPVSREPIIGRLGLEPVAPVLKSLKNGQAVEVLVKSPEKLVEHNIKGLSAGQKLMLKAVRANKLYELALPETGQKLLVQLGAQGSLKLLSPAGKGSAGQTVEAYEFYMKVQSSEGKFRPSGLGAEVKLTTPLVPVAPVLPQGGEASDHKHWGERLPR